MSQLSILPVTHAHLVMAAYKWVLKRGSCGVAFREFHTGASNGEQPDVIGFGCGTSVVIECKVSRADFFADAKKVFRKQPQLGMGRHRYYCTPTGLVTSDELPEGWGLLYVDESLKAKAHYRPIVDITNKAGHTYRDLYRFDCNIKAEHELMYSALRRLHIRGRIEEVYTELKQIEPQGGGGR